MTTLPYTLPLGFEAMTAAGLCDAARCACGLMPGEAVPNAGSIALAAWLLADEARAIREARRGGPLSMGHATRRLLCGAIEPSPTLADAIARMTEGAVTPEMWAQPACHEISGKRASIAVVDDPAPAFDPRPFADTYAEPGVLGETPAGPLFGVVRPTRACPYYEVHGYGLALRLNPAAAAALHGALDLALA
ncbi:MAG: hypothetical protein QHC65_14205 [Sphingomonas sp.]|nr:hypothetical protein [Sphingomonas sp.]MDX3885570.1 hypothetical protein [Sphingomonas sp.]